MKFAISLLIVGSLVSVSQGGFAWPKTRTALAQASNVAERFVCKALPKVKIPNIPLKAKKLSGSVSNIKIKKVVCPKIRISLDLKKRYLSLALSGFSVDLSANWRIKYKVLFFNIKKKGRIEVGGKRISASVVLGYTIRKGGKPYIYVRRCSAKIGSISVKFRGFLSFIYNLFKGAVKKQIDRRVPPLICKEVRNLVKKQQMKFLGQ